MWLSVICYVCRNRAFNSRYCEGLRCSAKHNQSGSLRFTSWDLAVWLSVICVCLNCAVKSSYYEALRCCAKHNPNCSYASESVTPHLRFPIHPVLLLPMCQGLLCPMSDVSLITSISYIQACYSPTYPGPPFFIYPGALLPKSRIFLPYVMF